MFGNVGVGYVVMKGFNFIPCFSYTWEDPFWHTFALGLGNVAVLFTVRANLILNKGSVCGKEGQEKVENKNKEKS